ncbi:alpha-amylase family glycosyl hydrolase [Mycoplasmopsis pullorum]|uniref:alpha-amylase family glycosyl hydrolase n=2 Tax=Mycoplasmopsis pullorum TaxID=48003 RepID=UPI001EE9BE89|nr:alpha-amylase family glycosyl hydrolase [Mycoplasmopsis pullorum]
MKKSVIFMKLATLAGSSCLLVPSCVNNAKKLKNWGDQEFTQKIQSQNMTHLSYILEAQNAKFIAPFNKQAPQSNVMYQLTVYSFADGNNDGIGDFIGLKNNLDYFSKLGVDTLYLSPIHPASSYHGYDVIDYLDVAPELGGMQAFDEFLIEAHKRGIAVILDLVFNHTSYEHPWFQAALRGEQKYRDFYRFYERKNDEHVQAYGIDDQNSIDIFLNIDKTRKPTNSEYVAEFWKGMPDLNLDNPEVVEELKAIQSFWSKKGVDGFRYDAFYHFWGSKNKYEPSDLDGTKTAKLFTQLRQASENAMNDGESRKSDKVFMFGEWWESPLNAKKYFAYQNNPALSSVIDGWHSKGLGNIQMNFNQNDDFLNSMNNLEKTVNHHVEWLPFLDNHDVHRWINNVRINELNGTWNEELSKLDQDLMKFGLSALLVKQGTPILYDGNELMMHGGPKERGDNLIREAFPWSDAKKNVDFYEKRSGSEYSRIFLNSSKDIPTIEKQMSDSGSAYNLTKKLIQIRQANSDMFKMKNLDLDPSLVIDSKASIGISENSIVVRKNPKENDDFDYLVYYFSFNQSPQNWKMVLKDNYKITDVLIKQNVSINQNQIVRSKSGFSIIAFKVKTI